MEAQEFRQGLSEALAEVKLYGHEQEAAIEAAGTKSLGLLALCDTERIAGAT
jgi:hypothetical protein